MSENFIIELLSLAVFFVVNYLKMRSDLKVTRRKSENSHEYLIKKIDGLELMVKTDIAKRDFKKDFANKLSLTGLNIISANSDLKKDSINILNSINENLIEFAIKYHSSAYRYDKKLIANYLKIELDALRQKNKHYANDIISTKKNNYDFMEFVKFYNPEIEVNINTLIQRLEENGLSNDDYISLFDNHVKTLFKYIIKGIRKWERI